MASYTRAQLLEQLNVLFPLDSGPEQYGLAEQLVLGALISALPEAEYMLHDPEAEDLPAGVLLLGGPVVAKFDHLPHTYGYGDVTLLQTRAGPGLCISVGGCNGQSAASVWLLPTALAGWFER